MTAEEQQLLRDIDARLARIESQARSIEQLRIDVRTLERVLLVGFEGKESWGVRLDRLEVAENRRARWTWTAIVAAFGLVAKGIWDWIGPHR